MRFPLVMLCSLSLESELRGQFHSMPIGQSLWVQSWCIGPGFPCSGATYWYDALVNDTVINGIGYTWLNNGGAIRDDLAGKVHIVPLGDTQEQLLYDFSAQPGDTLSGLFSEIWGIHSQVIVTVDTVTINGEDRRRMGVSHLDWGGSEASNYWIQGVGSLTGPIQTCRCPSVSGMTALSCMSENGIAQYGGAVGQAYDCLIHLSVEELGVEYPVMTIHPNPSTGLFTLSGTDLPVQVSVIDIQGREIQRTRERTIDLAGHPPGIYTGVVTTEQWRRSLRLLIIAP